MIQTGDPSWNRFWRHWVCLKDEFSDLKFDKGGVWLWPITDRQPTAANFSHTCCNAMVRRKAYHFLVVVEKGMDVVNTIVQNDYINKVTIIRNGEGLKKFNAVKPSRIIL
jgi:peptidylprolyl isomerase